LTAQLEMMGTSEISPPSGTNGEVFTRRWVAEFILDLVGYTPSEDLGSLSLVEPACGGGAFLVPIVDRLIASAHRHGRRLNSLGSAIQAFELMDANADSACAAVFRRLTEAGLSARDANSLADEWITAGDFLLDGAGRAADIVVGNPPYVRLEGISGERMNAYRAAWPTMKGRADVYVGFFEKGLSLLTPSGVLGFICADRWMRNQYGGELRDLITTRYAVDTVVSMHEVDAFEHEVSAYPAVVVLRREAQSTTAVIDAGAGFNRRAATEAFHWVRESPSREISAPDFDAAVIDGWFRGRDLWPVGSPSHLNLLADLEARFPPLEDARTGTRVGIGVATGCDDVYITKDPGLVEPERLLPLLRAADTANGVADWSGSYLVNPWDSDGLVSLEAFPRLQDHLHAAGDRLRARHVGRRRPHAWYRTIDRVNPELQGKTKLVLPDLKARAHPVLDEGRYYPHHNLYWVVSDCWDAEVLGGILLSEVCNLFVGAYCVRMRGGCYRFQAQYLRRIRVPDLTQVDPRTSQDLARAFRTRDTEAATAAAARLYGFPSSLLAPVGPADRRRNGNG
jgi:adenine-specific DNA-methyltransferase